MELTRHRSDPRSDSAKGERSEREKPIVIVSLIAVVIALEAAVVALEAVLAIIVVTLKAAVVALKVIER